MTRELVGSEGSPDVFGGINWALDSYLSGYKIMGCVTLDVYLILSGSQCPHL